MKRIKFLEANKISAHARGRFVQFGPHEVQELDDKVADVLILSGRFELTTEPITHPGPELETSTLEKAAEAKPDQVPVKQKLKKK